MKEFQIIQRLRQLRQPTPSGLIVGIGDDCAVLRIGGKEWLLTTDTLQEGIHFRRKWGTFADWGKRLAGAAVSDIAAMGGTPRYALLDWLLPKGTTQKIVGDFSRGLLHSLKRWQVTLIGGNISRTTGEFGASLTVLGDRPKGVRMLRSSAKAGDLVYLSGPVGHAALGLELLKRSRGKLAAGEEFITAFRHPKPALKLGQWLARHRVANACIDISDGLWQDLEHLAQASRIQIVIDAPKIPLRKNFVAVARQLHLDPLHLALTGGEDYILAFTSPRSRQKWLAKQWNLHPVGWVEHGKPRVRIEGKNRKVMRSRAKGYSHF